MGAAVRHAVAELMKVTAAVRVLMTLGDGFPNDVGYKDAYAIADTRKAVQEAYARQIHFKAITVNIAADPKLDELYGHLNHNVISDITELPDKLLRIYSAMTRM
jgi:nitric oxide reductase activation protein